MKKIQYAVGLLSSLAVMQSYAASALVEEVVVTAQKREQNLQDVSISITAFDGGQLEALGVEETDQLLQYIPNAKVEDRGAVDSISIRGISLFDIADTSETPVGFYIDEVYKATNAGQAVQFFDIERIEVLRGPQGTLFGRNTTAGLFHVVTRKPTEEFEFYVTGQVGSFNQRILETVVSGPLTDSVRGRLSYKKNEDDGYQKNLFTTGGTFAQTDSFALRGILDIDLAEDLSLTLSSSYSEIDNVASLSVFENISFGGGFDGFVNPIPNARNTRSALFTAFTEDNLPDDTDVVDATAKLEWSINETTTLTSISSWGRTKRNFIEEAAGPQNGTIIGNFQGIAFGFGEGAIPTVRQLEATQITQELRLSGATDALTWVGGVYYFQDDKDDGAAITLNPGLFNSNLYTLDTRSWAVFGQVDFSLTDVLTLITGVRYTEDKKDLDLLGQTATTTFTASPSFKSDSVTWKVGLDANLTDDLLLFANVATGFKSGAFNTNGISDPARTAPVSEEEVINYEAGWKATVLNGRARFNGTFFYSDYTDFQGVAFAQDPVTLNLVSQLINFGDAIYYGAELDFTMALTDNLDIMISGGWLESELDSDAEGSGETDGESLSNTPQFNLNAVAIYTFDLGDAGTLQSQLGVSWEDDFHFGEGGEPEIQRQDAYTLVDARLTWTSPDGHFSVSAFGKNLEDKEYRTSAVNAVGGEFRLVTFAQPTTWGVSATYRY